MINFLAKSLVLVHAVLSVGAMGWAIMLFLQGRDFGWKEPYKEVLDYTAEGKISKAVLHASEYDKSAAAVAEASKTRDRVYAQVKPTLESIRATEQYLPNNHLFYLAELRRLRESADKIEVKRLEKGPNALDTPSSNLGKPVPEANAVPLVAKSYRIYEADLKKVLADIDVVEGEIREVVNNTKKVTAQLTGTDEANKYVHPGLYQLIDLEFKYQGQIRIEAEELKPYWSKAVEQSRLLQIRRHDLQKTLDSLNAPMAPPPAPKIDKKL